MIDGRCADHPVHVFTPVEGGIKRAHLLERGGRVVAEDFLPAQTTPPLLQRVRFNLAWLALALSAASLGVSIFGR